MKGLKSIPLITALILQLTASAFHKNSADSMLNLLKKAHDTAKVNIYNQLAWEYRNSDLNLTDSFANIAIQKGTAKNYPKGVGQGYINLAFVQRNSGEYQLGLQSCRWALVHFVKSGYLQGYSSAYNTIASIHYMMGNYSVALYYYFKSLEISEQLSDQAGIARTLNNIGVIYMEQHIYDKALIYYNKAYNMLERLKDENGMADCLSNIGNIYHVKNNTEQAIITFEKSIEINRKIGDIKDVSATLNNIGLVYYGRGDYKQALDHYHQSLLIDQQMGDKNAIVVSYGNIASCYTKMNMYHAASKYGQESLQWALRGNMKTDVMNAYELLYEMELAQQNFKEALHYHELYKSYSDSIFNKESNDQIMSMEEKYMREKEEKEKVIQGKNKEVAKVLYQEREKHVTEYILVVGMVLLLFVFLIYLVFFIIRKPRTA